MAKQVKLRKGTTAEHATFTGAEAEITVDTTKHTVVVHDNATPGGYPLALEKNATQSEAGLMSSADKLKLDKITPRDTGESETPVGTIAMLYSPNEQETWLPCDGRVVLKEDYPEYAEECRSYGNSEDLVAVNTIAGYPVVYNNGSIDGDCILSGLKIIDKTTGQITNLTPGTIKIGTNNYTITGVGNIYGCYGHRYYGSVNYSNTNRATLFEISNGQINEILSTSNTYSNEYYFKDGIGLYIRYTSSTFSLSVTTLNIEEATENSYTMLLSSFASIPSELINTNTSFTPGPHRKIGTSIFLTFVLTAVSNESYVGVLISNDNGETWSGRVLNQNPITQSTYNTVPYYAYTYDRNNDKNFSANGSGGTSTPTTYNYYTTYNDDEYRINNICKRKNGDIVICSYGVLFVSSNNGSTWRMYTLSIPSYTVANKSYNCLWAVFESSNGNLFVLGHQTYTDIFTLLKVDNYNECTKYTYFNLFDYNSPVYKVGDFLIITPYYNANWEVPVEYKNSLCAVDLANTDRGLVALTPSGYFQPKDFNISKDNAGNNYISVVTRTEYSGSGSDYGYMNFHVILIESGKKISSTALRRVKWYTPKASSPYKYDTIEYVNGHIVGGFPVIYEYIACNTASSGTNYSARTSSTFIYTNNCDSTTEIKLPKISYKTTLEYEPTSVKLFSPFDEGLYKHPYIKVK